VIIFNLPGIVMAVIAFVPAFLIKELVGFTTEGPAMIIAGPLCVALDLAYRNRQEDGSFWAPGVGGALFFIPVWVWGIVWFLMGLVSTIRAQI
jgi:hypothetical protein